MAKNIFTSFKLNMMNNVSFTGLQNMGSCIQPYKIEGKGHIYAVSLLAKLTDDFQGKDLTEFENVLRKCSDSFNHRFPQDKNFIHIQTREFIPEDENFESIPKLLVNGYVVPTETKTMPLFSYIAKFTKKCMGISEKDYKIARDFKYGPDGDSYLTPIRISDYGFIPEKRKEFLDEVYSLDKVKENAEIINDNIQRQMMDYFA